MLGRAVLRMVLCPCSCISPFCAHSCISPFCAPIPAFLLSVPLFLHFLFLCPHSCIPWEGLLLMTNSVMICHSTSQISVLPSQGSSQAFPVFWIILGFAVLLGALLRILKFWRGKCCLNLNHIKVCSSNWEQILVPISS